MCAYRLVKIKFNVFGLQSRLEKLVDSVERNFYLQFHKQIFTLIDEWYGLTMDEIRTRECQLKHDLDAVSLINNHTNIYQFYKTEKI